MRCQWFFRNEPTEYFNEAPAFCVKSNCNPPEGHPAIDIFLSKLETEIFSILPGTWRLGEYGAMDMVQFLKPARPAYGSLKDQRI